MKGIIGIEDCPKCENIFNMISCKMDTLQNSRKAELLENRLNSLQTIEPYIGTFFSKEYVLKNVLSMTDAEIDEMQRQISKEAGMPPEDGGVSVPQATDGITRYPQDGGGGVIPADDVAKLRGEVPAEGGDENQNQRRME